MATHVHEQMALSYRLYKDETDNNQIREMCKNVYGGQDDLPHKIGLFAQDDSCRPFVAVRGEEVVAFCNMTRLETDDDTVDVIYIEAVRVSEAVRGQGVGTGLVREAMRFAASWCDSARPTRFLSTTIPSNLAMLKVFETTGWACRGPVHMWPSRSALDNAVQNLSNNPRRFLDALQVSKYVPQHALASVSSWQKLDTPSEVRNIMQRVHAQGGTLLRTGYYSVETIRNAARLATEDMQDGVHSVWKLERGTSPPVLLFIQKGKKKGITPFRFALVSASVVDVAGAESCVAFTASRKDLDAFRISFDPSITKDKMKHSALLSRVDTTTFLIYEAFR